jgi:hypothetical protein
MISAPAPRTMPCCGGTRVAYDKERVDALDERIKEMLAENGRPSLIRTSPDICHQITDGRTIKSLAGVNGLCDPELPPNSIVFEP